MAAPAPLSTWPDAVAMAAVAAVDPRGLGGVLLRARPGPVREAWLERLAELLPRAEATRRLPAHADEGRRLGGLDLAATLAAGRPVAQRGLYAEAHDGWLQVAMAERLALAVTAELCQALDTGTVVVEREGLSRRDAAAFGVIALDEGEADDEEAPAPLRERLALHLDLSMLGWRDTLAALDGWDAAQVAQARARLPAVTAGDDIVEALCAAASALGVDSLRASSQALRVARTVAALEGRDQVTANDASRAARWVLAARATQLPAPSADDAAPTDEPPPDAAADEPQNGASESEPSDSEHAQGGDSSLDDVVLEAARAAIPAGLLASLLAGRGPRTPAAAAGSRAGALQSSRLRGRPLGAQRGEVRGGARLALVATLRAAAPWQAVRRRERAAAQAQPAAPSRIELRRDDLHVRRFAQRRSTTTVFVVDASGSSALHRLAEAKGAVELLLADCYVRRDSVAVIAFRGTSAELLLPPTRSLVRAKRSLAGLPGGGGTPLAAGLDAAAALVAAIARRGDTPVLVLLTDGRANIARDGRPGREQAGADALASAARLRGLGAASVVIDTQPRGGAGGGSTSEGSPAARVAEAMGARHLLLPQAGSAAMSAAARAVAMPSGGARS